MHVVFTQGRIFKLVIDDQYQVNWLKLQYRYAFFSAYAVYRTAEHKQDHDHLRGTGDSLLVDNASPSLDGRERLICTSKGNSATPNQIKCPSIPNVGPIRRSVQMTKGTRSKSTHFTAVGDGLLQAAVDKPAHITVRADKSIRSKFYDKIFISVLAIGERHIFYASPSRVNLTYLEVNFTYIPTIPGKYDLFVEEIGRKWQRQLPGSPFKLIVDGPSLNEKEWRNKADQLPSCQTLPQTDLSWSEGNWVTRDVAGEKHGTLRSGWVLQPNECSIDIFTRQDLELAAASNTLKTIFVLGRSTERGVFLSLVDILLKKDEKQNIKSSVVWKCWGFMELRLGNLRFIYQDFRMESASMGKVKDKDHVNITCHNEKKVSSNNDFFGDAIGFFQETLFTDYFRPDVILMIVKYAHQLKLLSKVIPPSWTGSLYAMNGFKCQEGSVYTFEGRQTDLSQAKEFLTFDKRFLALDGFPLATPWRHSNQFSPEIMSSPHWHKICNDKNGDIRVCGDPTEMVAQILLGKALAPNGKDAWLKSLENCNSDDNNSTREITICHDCPKRLMPWHIKRAPNLICSTSSRLREINYTDIQAWDGSLCPSECMKTAPFWQGRYPTWKGRCADMYRVEEF